MLIMVPEDWKCPLPTGADVVRRGSGAGDSLEIVRKALADGERLFLFGVEGVSGDDCFVVANDHIALFGSSALAGPNRDELGPRFPSLMGIYISPEGELWSRGVVARVPDWKLATPAELNLLEASALVSGGIDEAETAGHGGAKVVLLVRCHGWESVNMKPPPLVQLAEAAEDLYNSRFTEGGEEREL